PACSASHQLRVAAAYRCNAGTMDAHDRGNAINSTPFPFLLHARNHVACVAKRGNRKGRKDCSYWSWDGFGGIPCPLPRWKFCKSNRLDALEHASVFCLLRPTSRITSRLFGDARLMDKFASALSRCFERRHYSSLGNPALQRL